MACDQPASSMGASPKTLLIESSYYSEHVFTCPTLTPPHRERPGKPGATLHPTGTLLAGQSSTAPPRRLTHEGYGMIGKKASGIVERSENCKHRKLGHHWLR